MVVVAGRLTALSEDRNVLPTVAIGMTTTSTDRRGQSEGVMAGYMPVKGMLSSPQPLRYARRKTQ